MINSKDRVKFKSANVFVEANPPADRSRPLEWRRSVNTIEIDATHFVIKEHHIVSKQEYSTNDLDEHKKVLTPKSGSRTVISSKIALETIRDSLYRTVEEDKEEKIYSFAKSQEFLNLTLTDDEPLEEPHGIFASGMHYGHAWIEEDNEELTVNVSVGKDVLKNLVSEIKSGRVAEVQLHIAIDSFSYEVDDFLREWYHPRDLVLDGRMVLAAVESLSVVSKEYYQQSPSLAKLESKNNDEEGEPQSQLYQPHINNVIDPTHLKSIKNVLWFIFGALIVMWLSGR